MVHAVWSGGWSVGTRRSRHCSSGCRHSAQTRCHRARKHRPSSRRHRCRSGDRCSGCIEAVDGALVIRRDHGGQRVHWPWEALGAERAGNFRCPVIVRVGWIQWVCVRERLHQAIELSAEAVLEIRCCCRRGVHGIPFALPPLGASVLEPYL